MISSQNQHQVFAVVVTYNRLALLKNTLAALKAQLYSLTHIIVVNNDSSDGTAEWLEQQNGIQVINQANLGGAGGFHTGVKAAYEAGADWVWMMDDDVAPDKNCLEELMKYGDQSECLHPLRLDCEGVVQDEERWFDPASCKIFSLFNASYNEGKKIWFRNIGSFEGMLIKSTVVQKIGFPDQRFFITHDDLVYGFLASRFTNVAVVTAAIIRKLPVQKNDESLYRYLYYYHRNLWMVREYAEKSLIEFTAYRNRRIKIQFLYAGYKIFRFREYKSNWKALRTLFLAYRDYKKKKSGAYNG